MITLKKLNATEYSEASTFFRSKEVKDMTRNYFNYVYTASLDYAKTGDVNILNSVMVCAKLVNRFRMTKQLVSVVSAHQMGANGKYKGKAKTSKLALVRKNLDQVKERQEKIINADTQEREAKAQTFDVDQTTTRAVNAIAALLAHDIDVDVVELVKQAKLKQAKIKVKEQVKAGEAKTAPTLVGVAA